MHLLGRGILYLPPEMRLPRSYPLRSIRFGTFLGGGKFMIKKVLVLAALALALPMAAFASGNIEFQSSGGSLTGGASGVSLSGAVLTRGNASYGGGLLQGSNLGRVSARTGAPITGPRSA